MFDPELDRWLRRRERMRLLKESARALAGGFVAATVTYGLLWLAMIVFGGTGR